MLIKILTYFVDNLLFLGKGELEKAIRVDSKIKEKSVYFPWCVDRKFWKVSDELKNKNKEKIVFVGNDGNRNDVLLTEIAKKLPQYNFIFVTNILKLVDLKLENVEIIQGQWGKSFLTDLELKDIYSSARISIIPLKESSQPSGQSVALQSMSLGVPVMISDTKGFWDRDTLIDKKHLILVKDNNVQEWIEQIDRFYKNKNKLKAISQNALEITKLEFSMKKFNNQILKLISDQN
jgi:glycosyltransferase involved in cell wall biosynthesis